MQAESTKKMAVFWVVALCSLVEVYRHFRGICCLHHQGDSSPWWPWNIGKLLPDYTVLLPRRQPSSYSPPWEPQIVPSKPLWGGYFLLRLEIWNPSLIALMMEAASTSETLVNFYQTTRCYDPEDSHLHSCRHENLKSYLFWAVSLEIWVNHISNGTLKPEQEILIVPEVKMIILMKFVNNH
jgi:hypothetical protein